MTRNRLGQAATALIALVALAGCDRVGNPLEVLVARPPAPDEFQVIARRPLQMPMSVSLPEPRLGAPSPLEPDPNRDAVVALMGRDLRPAAAGTSAGEQALLAAANAQSSDPAIRATLAAGPAAGANEPYEAPYLWELIGLGGDGGRTRDAIDAAAEARRLQSEGVAAAPIDPTDRPAEEATAPAADPDPNRYPVQEGDRAPRNTLPSSGPVPAF